MLKTAALILFVIMYIAMIAKPKFRPVIALTVAAVFVCLGIVPFSELPFTINWNVLMMISGTMIIVYYFIESLMPNLLADMILNKSKNAMWVTILMSLFAGLISAFIDNVATVLMVAPVGLAVCKKLKMNPVGMILSIAVSSNLQGAATLVGDTTSIMLAAYADMNFMEFFWMEGRLGIFFAVEIGALATVPIMMILFRKDRDPVSSADRTKVNDYVPTWMLLIMVLALIIASFIPNTPNAINGIICMFLAMITMGIEIAKNKGIKEAKDAILELDFETLGLLLGLFIVIGGLTQVGVIDDFAAFIVKVGGDNIFLLYTIIVWGSVIISAFVDNIPYVATMLPVLAAVTASLGVEPYLLYFGLLSGATLGGNITPIGASANIAATGLLKKEGYEVSFKDFMRIGVPYTLTAVFAGYVYLWIVWG
ncbi:MAG: TRAP transporter large permease subunit [Clostridiales bacterium]|nr:TRAP transporter large permease subunit [Clostridiales bacterium]